MRWRCREGAEPFPHPSRQTDTVELPRQPSSKGRTIMKRLTALTVMTGLLGLGLQAFADEKEKDPTKEALQALQEFIGSWKGNGGPEKAKPTAKELWSETLSWG